MKADPLDRLQELCARSEQCVYDLRRKLAQWRVPEVESRKIIDSLIDERYVDDARYARAFARDKARFERWGRLKIRMTLAAKRIPQAVIADALEQIDEEAYAEGLMATLRAKARQLGDEAATYEGRGKLYRAACQRGYEPSLVIEAIKSPALWADSR